MIEVFLMKAIVAGVVYSYWPDGTERYYPVNQSKCYCTEQRQELRKSLLDDTYKDLIEEKNEQRKPAPNLSN